MDKEHHSGVGTIRKDANMGRFFVDERVGCIAVRDRENTDMDYPGLHADTEGVVKYWHGVLVPGEICSKCSHKRDSKLMVTLESRQEAEALCERLNNGGLIDDNIPHSR